MSLIASMKLLVNGVVEQLRGSYDLQASRTTNGDYYVDHAVRAGDLAMSVGMIAGESDEDNVPLWPYVFVPNSDQKVADEAADLLGAETTGLANYPGRWAFPTNERLSHFHSAWDWQEQRGRAFELWKGWFEILATAGLVKRK
jgi:hypothetical protein